MAKTKPILFFCLTVLCFGSLACGPPRRSPATSPGKPTDTRFVPTQYTQPLRVTPGSVIRPEKVNGPRTRPKNLPIPSGTYHPLLPGEYQPLVLDRSG